MDKLEHSPLPLCSSPRITVFPVTQSILRVTLVAKKHTYYSYGLKNINVIYITKGIFNINMPNIVEKGRLLHYNKDGYIYLEDFNLNIECEREAHIKFCYLALHLQPYIQ